MPESKTGKIFKRNLREFGWFFHHPVFINTWVENLTKPVSKQKETCMTAKLLRTLEKLSKEKRNDSM